MPFVLPTRFTAGDTFEIPATALADYPASAGWVLKLRFVPRSAGTPIDITGTASGDDHVATVAAATTASWGAGTYSANAYVELAGAKYSVESCTLTIAADPRVATTLDNRTAAQTALDNVRATIQGTATANVLSYTIGGRSLQHYSIPDLLLLEGKLVQDVRRERAAADLLAGRPNRRQTFVRIGRA